MAKTIQQSVKFSASSQRLFNIYMDSRRHGVPTNSRASVSRKVGGKFSAFDGALTGRMLAIVPNRMIVQTWRGSNWKKTDPDSILILTFSRAPGGTRVNLVHANIPDPRHASIQKGWTTYYWKPWRTYLRRR